MGQQQLADPRQGLATQFTSEQACATNYGSSKGLRRSKTFNTSSFKPLAVPSHGAASPSHHLHATQSSLWVSSNTNANANPNNSSSNNNNSSSNNNHGRVSSGSVVSSVSSSACQRLTVEALRQLEIETQHLGHWRSASDMFLASPPESDTSSQESSPLYSPFTGVQQQQQQQQPQQQCKQQPQSPPPPCRPPRAIWCCIVRGLPGPAMHCSCCACQAHSCRCCLAQLRVRWQGQGEPKWLAVAVPNFHSLFFFSSLIICLVAVAFSHACLLLLFLLRARACVRGGVACKLLAYVNEFMGLFILAPMKPRGLTCVGRVLVSRVVSLSPSLCTDCVCS